MLIHPWMVLQPRMDQGVLGSTRSTGSGPSSPTGPDWCIVPEQSSRNRRLMVWFLRCCKREKPTWAAGVPVTTGAPDIPHLSLLESSGCFSANPVALILHTQKAWSKMAPPPRLPPNPPPVPLFCALAPHTPAKAGGTSGSRGWGGATSYRRKQRWGRGKETCVRRHIRLPWEGGGWEVRKGCC